MAVNDIDGLSASPDTFAVAQETSSRPRELMRLGFESQDATEAISVWAGNYRLATNYSFGGDEVITWPDIIDIWGFIPARAKLEIHADVEITTGAHCFMQIRNVRG